MIGAGKTSCAALHDRYPGDSGKYLGHASCCAFHCGFARRYPGHFRGWPLRFPCIIARSIPERFYCPISVLHVGSPHGAGVRHRFPGAASGATATRSIRRGRRSPRRRPRPSCSAATAMPRPRALRTGSCWTQAVLGSVVVVGTPTPNRDLMVRSLRAGAAGRAAVVAPCAASGGSTTATRSPAACALAIERKRQSRSCAGPGRSTSPPGCRTGSTDGAAAPALSALREREPAPMALLVLASRGWRPPRRGWGVVARRRCSASWRCGCAACRAPAMWSGVGARCPAWC